MQDNNGGALGTFISLSRALEATTGLQRRGMLGLAAVSSGMTLGRVQRASCFKL